MSYETQTSILPTAKETKHQRYNRSPKGKERDYRRYKKRLQNRIAHKLDQIMILEAELKVLNAQEIRYRTTKGQNYEDNTRINSFAEVYRSGRVNQ